MCVYICTHTFIYHLCVPYVYCLDMGTWGALPCKCMHRGQSLASEILLYDYPPDFLRQNVFLRPHTVSASLASQRTPGSDRTAPSTGATEVHRYSQFLNTCWGFKLRLSSLYHTGNKHVNHWKSPQPLFISISLQLFVFPPTFQICFCLLPSTIVRREREGGCELLS